NPTETIQRAALPQFEHATAPSLMDTILGDAPVSALMGEPVERPSSARTPTSVMAARSVIGKVGAPTPAHLRYAEELRNAIPETLQTAARDSLGASALVYALLIGSNPELRSKQLQLVAQNT